MRSKKSFETTNNKTKQKKDKKDLVGVTIVKIFEREFFENIIKVFNSQEQS